MSNNVAIFPNWDQKIIRLDDDAYGNVQCKLVLRAKLRKFDDKTNKWYWWDHYRECTTKGIFESNDVYVVTKQFINEVYLSITCGIVDLDLILIKNGHPEPAFTECETQESESQRLEKLLYNK